MDRPLYGSMPHAVATNGDGNGRIESFSEPSIAELFKRLSVDSTHLVRQELSLAKTELKETGTHVARMASKLAIAFILAIPGVMAIGAFLIIAIGDAINNYWASSLIVGVILLALAAVFAQRGRAEVTRLGMPETAKTLRDDARWAQDELQRFKQEFKA